MINFNISNGGKCSLGQNRFHIVYNTSINDLEEEINRILMAFADDKNGICCNTRENSDKIQNEIKKVDWKYLSGGEKKIKE